MDTYNYGTLEGSNRVTIPEDSYYKTLLRFGIYLQMESCRMQLPIGPDYGLLNVYLLNREVQ